MPFDPAQLAINADVDVVLLADTNLGTMQHPFLSAFEAQQDVAVIVELAAFDKSCDIGGQFLDLQAGDVLSEIFRVRADVAHGTGGAAAFGVSPPAGLFL